MEIERLNNPTRPVTPGDPVSEAGLSRGGRARPSAEDSGLTVAADTIEISEHARELARAQQAVEAAHEVRGEKVAQIKQRIEDGTYSVPIELLAQRLLDGWSNDR